MLITTELYSLELICEGNGGNAGLSLQSWVSWRVQDPPHLRIVDALIETLMAGD